jgi:hypothetical protein
MPEYAQTTTQNDVTLADLLRYLDVERKVLEEDRKAREQERKVREQERKVYEEELKKLQQETEKSRQELDRKLSKLGDRMGDVTEHSFNPEVVLEKFVELGYELEHSARDYVVRDEHHKTIAEIDIFLQNGDDIILVEIKTKLLERHIDEHIERIKAVQTIEKFRKNKFIGAVAGAVISESVKNYALKQGLYVIEQTGETIRIETQDNKFVPRRW